MENSLSLLSHWQTAVTLTSKKAQPNVCHREMAFRNATFASSTVNPACLLYEEIMFWRQGEDVYLSCTFVQRLLHVYTAGQHHDPSGRSQQPTAILTALYFTDAHVFLLWKCPISEPLPSTEHLPSSTPQETWSSSDLQAQVPSASWESWRTVTCPCRLSLWRAGPPGWTCPPWCTCGIHADIWVAPGSKKRQGPESKHKQALKQRYRINTTDSLEHS